jgi:hypothetical protein
MKFLNLFLLVTCLLLVLAGCKREQSAVLPLAVATPSPKPLIELKESEGICGYWTEKVFACRNIRITDNRDPAYEITWRVRNGAVSSVEVWSRRENIYRSVRVLEKKIEVDKSAQQYELKDLEQNFKLSDMQSDLYIRPGTTAEKKLAAMCNQLILEYQKIAPR